MSTSNPNVKKIGRVKEIGRCRHSGRHDGSSSFAISSASSGSARKRVAGLSHQSIAQVSIAQVKDIAEAQRHSRKATTNRVCQ